MIHHVTYHVPEKVLQGPDLSRLMNEIGFVEIPANDKFEHGYNVRWFKASGAGIGHPPVHFVADDSGLGGNLRLGHLCVSGVGLKKFEELARSHYCSRNSGSGRIWLELPSIRIEVRP